MPKRTSKYSCCCRWVALRGEGGFWLFNRSPMGQGHGSGVDDCTAKGCNLSCIACPGMSHVVKLVCTQWTCVWCCAVVWMRPLSLVCYVLLCPGTMKCQELFTCSQSTEYQHWTVGPWKLNLSMLACLCMLFLSSQPGASSRSL